MKKRFMILPPFLVIFMMYGALPDMSAATEGTTGTTETILQVPILNELPPGIQLPETVTETNVASTPSTTTTESPPAEMTAVDEQMTETPAPPTEQPLPETADPQPTTTETTSPATTPSEDATTPEASNPTTPTTGIPAPETAIPTESPTEQPAPGTESPIVTETPVENPTPTVPTEPVPSEVPESPTTTEPIEEPQVVEESEAEIAYEEHIGMNATASIDDYSGPSQIINSVNISDNVIALTFDDGHSYGNLYDILYNLKYLGVKATFFMNGDADASLLQQIVADGHQLANHTYSHGDSTTLSSSGLANDINLMEDYIQETTGTSSSPFFRLPYGSYNSSVLDTVGSLGYKYTIGWDVDTLDWTGISATAISDAVVSNVRPGSIVLMHASVGAANTPESLWYSIAALKQSGYSFSTVSNLLALAGYFTPDEEEPIEEDYSDAILSEVINQVQTGEKTISLTISDASDAENVREILANLATMDVKATFFLNGLTDAAVINEIIQQGHEIGNHTYTHDAATEMTVDEIVWELNTLETLVQDSTGGATTRPYFRAPMGETNNRVLATVASMGYQYTIGWTVDTRDWSGTLTSAQVSSAVVNNLAPGAIFLLHGNASANTTPAALLQMITAIRQLGYNFATISGLLALEGSYPTIPGDEPGETTPDPDPNPPSTTSPAEIVNQVNTDVPVISLTISDASGTQNVRQILNNLALLGIKATFFLNGMTDPSLIDEIIAQGHEIGNHTYSHEDATLMTGTELTADLNNLDQLVQNAAGTSTKPYFRAPMGETNAAVLATAGSLGYQYAIGWTIETRDWSGTQTASQISSTIVNSVAPGAILLLHGSADAVATPAAILQMVAAVQALGYRFETITGLLAYQGIYTGTPPVVVDPDDGEIDYGTGPSRFVNHVDTGRNVIALTFDDGDDYTNLHDIIWNLNALGAKATFFLNGTTDPGLMAELVASGHQLANHTYSHNDDSTSLSADALAYDLALMEEYILETTGVSSKPYFRAPAGVYNDAVLETVGSLGYAYTIGWTQDTRDWEGLSDIAIAASVTDYLDAGSIYLLHANPTSLGTPESLWYIVAEARRQGFEFVTIDELMALEGVYDDGEDDDVYDGISQFIEQIDTNKKVISLTFDDLGDSQVLQEILDVLYEMDVKATFFPDGTVDPDMLYQVVSQGHEVGNHTYSHEFSTYLTIEELSAEMNALENKVQNATGTSTKPLFRPPFGDFDQSVLETVGSLGYKYTIGWSVDSLDYLGTLSPEDIAFNVLDQLAPGYIYLMHAVPESSSTPSSLYEIIRTARELGYSFATITDLIALDGMYETDPSDPVDTTISQVIDQVTTGEKVVSLTISDASDAANVRQILANLATLNVKATFFLNGLTDPTLIDDIIAQGHEIGNHTYSHDDATQRTAAQLTTDLNNLEQLVQNASGTSTKPYFRAPMGATNATVLTTAGTLGYDYTIGWTVDTRDWSGTLTAAQVSSAVVNNLTPGSIFLLHGNSSAATTPAALLEMVAAARALGYEFRTITGLLALQGIYPDPVDPVDPVDPDPPVIKIPSQLVNQVNTNQQVISLTISDVSSAENLRQILANLALLDVKATFFLNGLTDPTLIDDILAQGHEIGNHTFSHDDATQMTTAELTSDLNQLEQLVKTATGESTKPYFRAPMGATNATVLATAGSLGYSYTIGWTIDTRDWSGTLSASQVSAAVLNNLSAGAIYLLHGNSSANTTPTALLEMITAARALGYQFRTISELLAYEGDYSYVEPEPEFVIPVLDEFGNITNPVITRNDVTDVYNPLGTADPFIILVDGVYHMFFEVLRDYNIATQSFTDSVAHAYSSDLANWTYTQVVLGPETDGIRAAYPNVFEYNDNYYMVPDQAGNVEAFFATSFPLGWDYHSTLLEGNFVDTNVFEVGGTWYLTTSEQPYNSISLYYNTSGDWRNDQWQLHPAGLIIEEDWTEKGYRGAGNLFVFEDYVVMPVQVTPVATNVYGEYTSWYKLSDLSTTTVTVEYLGEAVGAQNNGQWNDLAMHHIAHAPYGDGYVYVVDGLAYYAASTGQAEYTIGIFTQTA